MKSILSLAIVFFLIVSFNKAEAQNIDPRLTNLEVSAGIVNDKIVLGVKSERMYPTTGYNITYRVEKRKNKTYIKFWGTTVPEEGSTVFAPATCYIDLGKLEHGEYEITFEHNEKKTNGKLIVGSTLELTIDKGSNIKLK
jgi:hypothetical protein